MLTLNQLPILLLGTIFALVPRTYSYGNKDEASLRSLSQSERLMAKDAGHSYVDRLAQLDKDLYAQGFHVKEGSGSPMCMMAKFKRPSQEVIDLSKRNMRFVETVRILKNEFGLKEEEIEQTIRNEGFDPGCLNATKCLEADTYRTFDGSCNHRDELTNLGRAASGYRRFLKPAYDDGVSSPRSRSISGTELPSPRFISMNAFSNEDRPLGKVTSLLMQFGQFINHDMEATSTFSFSNGQGFSCCAPDNVPLSPSVLSSLVHCLPITIPTGDKQLHNGQPGCMNFVRSSTGPNRISCDLPFVSYAEQFNQNSHWLDASTVYGSSRSKQRPLINPNPLGKGMLSYSIDLNQHKLLPQFSCEENGCFFNAGDSRVNEQPQLTVMHTIWMREHNRIASYLANLNPNWCSETIFQEARRIVIAELQHITYNEFLPALLGRSGMKINRHLWSLLGANTFQVKPESKEWMRIYEDMGEEEFKLKTVTSGPVSNEFAAAAFRMGHSLVQGDVQLINEEGKVRIYNMSKVFNTPDLSTDPSFLDDTIRGLVNQNSQTVDNQITDALWLHLFQSPVSISSSYGSGSTKPVPGILDIVAINIQRGRDHGLPSYNNYREKCGIKRLGGFGDMPTEKPENVDPSQPINPYFDKWVKERLQKLYENVDDIDLFIGGLAEINPLDDSLPGPTFACIIADNFLQLKYQDRYFYEAGAGTNPNPFTPEQLMEIRETSMARILCDNNDGTVKLMQLNPFFVPNNINNFKVECENLRPITGINLNHWKACTNDWSYSSRFSSK